MKKILFLLVLVALIFGAIPTMSAKAEGEKFCRLLDATSLKTFIFYQKPPEEFNSPNPPVIPYATICDQFWSAFKWQGKMYYCKTVEFYYDEPQRVILTGCIPPKLYMRHKKNR